jgi:hypothetical protein
MHLAVIMLVVVMLAAPLAAYAAVVGRFTLVRGDVDVLRGGKIPGIPAKVQDGVEEGDIIRTKSKAKAQLKMVDDSIITLAPESRLAIAHYQYNPVRGERRAVLRAFRGLVHTVVNRIIKTEEPDFLMETHTATLGVRGTNWYTLLGPNFTSAFLLQGILGVKSNLPTLPALLLLQSGQFTQIPQGKQPFPPQPLTPQILKMLEKLMDTGLSGSGVEFGLPAPGAGGQSQLPFAVPGSPDQKLMQQTIPPVLAPPHQIPAPAQPAPSRGPSGPGGPTGHSGP